MTPRRALLFSARPCRQSRSGNASKIRYFTGQPPDGSREPGRELADLLDLDLHRVAGLEELAAGRADARRRAGQHQVAGMQGDRRGEMRDLLLDVEDHLAGIGILLDDVV